MSLESHLFLRGYFANLLEGSRNIAGGELINLAAPADVTVGHLLAGDNQIIIPATAAGCIIFFDSHSTVIKKLKGIAADTGFTLHPTNWFVLSFTVGGNASFWLNASAEDNATINAVLTNLNTEIVFF